MGAVVRVRLQPDVGKHVLLREASSSWREGRAARRPAGVKWLGYDGRVERQRVPGE